MMPIFAVCRDEHVARQLHLWRGIFPLHYGGKSIKSFDSFLGNFYVEIIELESKLTKIYLASRESDWSSDVDARINYGISVGKERGFIKNNDLLVVITGWRQGSFVVFILISPKVFCFLSLFHLEILN